MSAESISRQLLESAGITINGPNKGDIKVNNPALYKRVLGGGSLALGESYMDGWWDCDRLDQFFDKVLRAKLDQKVVNNKRLMLTLLAAKLINMQNKVRAWKTADHYNTGNFLYQKMLGKSMTYSCGDWKKAKNLDQAQEDKLDLVCRKLHLKPGMKVLDIGCGWGSFAKHAATKYKVKVVGITISEEQAKFARESCKGLPVDIVVQDYRDTQGTFDRVVSIGMAEHVGYKNLRTYLQKVASVLKDDGLFLYHSIGALKGTLLTDAWIRKYIFPNASLPSMAQVGRASEGLLIIEDWHNFGQDYDTTLMEWHKNFVKHWPEIKKSGNYDDRFFRMWTYYLRTCAGMFRSRQNNMLYQGVFSKDGFPGRYEAVR